MAGRMAHSVADVIRWLLIGLGKGTRPTDGGEWPVFAGKEPNDPDDCITVYTTEGIQHGRTNPDGERQGAPGVQIRVRSGTGPRGHEKANDIAISLDEDVYMTAVTVPANTAGVYPVPAGNYTVQSVRRTGDVLGIGEESPVSKRQIFVVNATVTLWQN